MGPAAAAERADEKATTVHVRTSNVLTLTLPNSRPMFLVCVRRFSPGNNCIDKLLAGAARGKECRFGTGMVRWKTGFLV